MISYQEAKQIMASLANMNGLNISGETHVPMRSIVHLISSYMENDTEMTLEGNTISISQKSPAVNLEGIKKSVESAIRFTDVHSSDKWCMADVNDFLTTLAYELRGGKTKEKVDE